MSTPTSIVPAWIPEKQAFIRRENPGGKVIYEGNRALKPASYSFVSQVLSKRDIEFVKPSETVESDRQYL